MTIHYSIADTGFGKVTLASTGQGICCVSFTDDPEKELSHRFRSASLILQEMPLHQRVVHILNNWPDSAGQLAEIPLHLMGTDFQVSVWNALLKLKPGEKSTYKAIAAQAGRPTAVRATGTAIGQNPVAVLVPCHRVLTSSGKTGGYRWGTALKLNLLTKEHGNYP